MSIRPKKINLTNILSSMEKINIPLNYSTKSKNERAISNKHTKSKKEYNLKSKNQNIFFNKNEIFNNAQLKKFSNKKDKNILANKPIFDKTLYSSSYLADKTLKIYPFINTETGSSKESTSISSPSKNSPDEKINKKNLNGKKFKSDKIKVNNIKQYKLIDDINNDKDNMILNDSLFDNNTKNSDSKRTKFSNSMSYDKNSNNISLDYSCSDNETRSKNQINIDDNINNNEALDFQEFWSKMNELLFKK